MRKLIDYQGFTPSRWMSRWVVCGVALFFAACSVDPAERPEPQIQTEAATRAQVDAMAQVRALAVENAVYHAATDSWIAEQGDPYRLDNFQKAYDKLAATTKGFEKTKQLQPTHYALKIYPKTEEEQNRIEGDKEVQVAYVPFDHIQLTEAEVARKVRSKTATTFGEMSPYTVTYTDMVSTDGGPVGDVTIQLPILYVVWPIEKPLPTDIEYTIDYEVFLPRAATEQAELLRALEDEAIAEAFGVPVPVREAPVTRAQLPPPASGKLVRVVIQDDVIGSIALDNLRVREQAGSNIYDTYTTGGFFFIHGLSGGTVSLIYQDPGNKWKITPSSSSTSPYSVTLGTTANVIPPSGGGYQTFTLSEPRQENTIHRAADYFFNVQNAFPKYVLGGGGVRIVANAGVDAIGNPGYFTRSGDNMFITINNWNYSSGLLMGVILHELGHFTHYREDNSNNYKYYNRTKKLLRESFAEYVAWYLGEQYYTSFGWSKSYANQDITNCGEQNWVKTRTIANDGAYSPVFIDLADTYNQRTQGTIYPIDTISGVPPSVIWNIIINCVDLSEFKRELNKYAGTGAGKYYSSYQLTIYIADYEYWFNIPSNNVSD